jgi:hypothetical protein
VGFFFDKVLAKVTQLPISPLWPKGVKKGVFLPLLVRFGAQPCATVRIGHWRL